MKNYIIQNKRAMVALGRSPELIKTAVTLVAITNLWTNFYEDWTINVTSTVLTRKTAPPPGGYVFNATGTFFQTQPTFIRTNDLTKFHEDLTINLTPRVKTAPTPGGHIFQRTRTILKLN
ncbi:hypothetical protein DPMN_016143 [Dreissena polymorpha]|uniref:Uncharacterized protein n=1 Tax=Dreissena polymorpha TaxID=45954 RepID=A0A9D4NCX1_DREPO|nr:hypothetical protein DPMN_016143 [Dreissena polymorpha]